MLERIGPVDVLMDNACGIATVHMPRELTHSGYRALKEAIANPPRRLRTYLLVAMLPRHKECGALVKMLRDLGFHSTSQSDHQCWLWDYAYSKQRDTGRVAL